MTAPDTKVATVDPKQPVGTVKNLRQVISQQWKTIAAVLPAHFQNDRFGALVVSCAARTPKVLSCTGLSILDAMFQAASLGLEINAATGEAYLLPFKEKAQLIPGYKGLVKLAIQSPEVSAVEVRLVYEGEKHFRVHYGTDSRIEHEPDFEVERTPDTVKFAYGVAKMRNQGVTFEVMSRKQLDAIRARSKSKDDGPWVTDREEMYRKTVARRLCKYLPMTPQLADAIELADRAETGDFEGKDGPSVGALALDAAIKANAKKPSEDAQDVQVEPAPLPDWLLAACRVLASGKKLAPDTAEDLRQYREDHVDRCAEIDALCAKEG